VSRVSSTIIVGEQRPAREKTTGRDAEAVEVGSAISRAAYPNICRLLWPAGVWQPKDPRRTQADQRGLSVRARTTPNEESQTVKRQPKGAKERTQTIQVWTYEQAQAAAPYIASILRSLREHALEALQYYHRARRLANRPGRPDRSALIAQQEAEHEARRADQRFRDDLAELQALDIYTLDPVQGLALVPFVYNDQLAWYIFDLFDTQPLRFWRYQSDPEDTRRPVTTMQRLPYEGTRIV
jgi:hypothetical protein